MGRLLSGWRALPLAALALALALALSIAVGASSIPLADVLAALSGGGDPTTRAIVLGLRLPRAVLAALAGGALAVSGAVFQALLRNPLAEPYVLGVSGGAAVGAVAALALGWAASPWLLPLAAFAGALLAIWVVLRIALAVGPTLSPRVFILAGVVVGAFFNALIMLALAVGDLESFRSAVFWIMGNLGGSDWGGVLVLSAYLAPVTVLVLGFSRTLNLLAVGEETAGFLGVRVERTKRTLYVAASLLVAATVALTGVIGFVGLIVPHAVRLVLGSDHRIVLPASLLVGGAFLLLTDTAARVLLAPTELPTGVVTALIGVPLFLFLLVRTGS